MPENARPSRGIDVRQSEIDEHVNRRFTDAIELGFVKRIEDSRTHRESPIHEMEREATPQFAMKLGIQMHLAGLSLSNTKSVLESLGVERVRSTIHNWVHKADLQPNDDMNPNQVAVDETMIRLNGDWYWLYMAVDPDSNNILHTKLQPTRNHYTAKDFMNELIKRYNLENSLFLVDGLPSLHQACRSYSLRFRVTKHGNRNSVERVFRELKRRTRAFSNSFSNAHLQTADDWLKSYTNRRFVCS